MPKPRLTEPMKRVIRALADGAAITRVRYKGVRGASLTLWVMVSGYWTTDRRLSATTFSAIRDRRLLDGRITQATDEFVRDEWDLSERGLQVAEELKRESVAQ